MTKYPGSTTDLSRNNRQYDLNNFINEDQENQLRKSSSLNNLTQIMATEQLNKANTSSINDINKMQDQRSSLLDKKRLKWTEDSRESTYFKCLKDRLAFF